MNEREIPTTPEALVRRPPIETVAFGWGVTEDGQLGLMQGPTTKDIPSACILSPKVVEGLLGTKFRGRDGSRRPVVAGSRCTMVVTSDGQVYSFGWNDRATLGQGHKELVTKPSRVVGLQGVHVVQVALGGWHALALDRDGGCWAWGGNEYNQCDALGVGRDISTPARALTNVRAVQVAAGGMHSVALSESGEVWQWGEPWGEFEMTVNREPRRLRMRGMPQTAAAATAGERFVRVACGSFHNLALTASGAVYSWGINDYGQLGDGTTINARDLVLVQGLEGVVVVDIACGGWHSVAITEEGDVYVWGRGEYGRLGLGEKGASKLVPRRVEGLEGHKVVEASAGGTHTVVVTEDGRMFIWGRGSFGRLGTGNEQNHFAPVEVYFPGGPERWWIIAAAAGGRHTMALAVPDNGDLGGEKMDMWDRRSSDLASLSLSASVGASVGVGAASVDGNSRGPSRSATPMGSAVKVSAPSSRWSETMSEEKHKDEEDADDEEDDEDEEESQVSELDGESEDRDESRAGSQRAPSFMNMVKSLELEEMNFHDGE